MKKTVSSRPVSDKKVKQIDKSKATIKKPQLKGE